MPPPPGPVPVSEVRRVPGEVGVGVEGGLQLALGARVAGGVLLLLLLLGPADAAADECLLAVPPGRRGGPLAALASPGAPPQAEVLLGEGG